MTSLFDVPVSIGQRIGSNKVQRGPLGKVHFERHSVISGDPADKDGAYFCPSLMRGTTRRSENVLRCSLIAIDID